MTRINLFLYVFIFTTVSCKKTTFCTGYDLKDDFIRVYSLQKEHIVINYKVKSDLSSRHGLSISRIHKDSLGKISVVISLSEEMTPKQAVLDFFSFYDPSGKKITHAPVKTDNLEGYWVKYASRDTLVSRFEGQNSATGIIIIIYYEGVHPDAGQMMECLFHSFEFEKNMRYDVFAEAYKTEKNDKRITYYYAFGRREDTIAYSFSIDSAWVPAKYEGINIRDKSYDPNRIMDYQGFTNKIDTVHIFAYNTHKSDLILNEDTLKQFYSSLSQEMPEYTAYNFLYEHSGSVFRTQITEEYLTQCFINDSFYDTCIGINFDIIYQAKAITGQNRKEFEKIGNSFEFRSEKKH